MGTFQNRRGRMLFLCPVFTRDKTEGHDYKIVLKCVHLFSSKKGGIAWDFSVSCLFCIHLVSLGITKETQMVKKKSACTAEDPGQDSPGEGNVYPLRYSCLGNSMDSGAWWITVHGVTNSWTRLSNYHFNFTWST